MELGVSAKDVHNKKELVGELMKAGLAQSERRKFPRIDKNLHIEFSTMDSLAKNKLGKMKNISSGGFCMEISSDHTPPQVNEVIEISMRDEKEKQDIVAIGRVAWVRETEGQEGFEVGVMLTYVREEDQSRFK